MNIVLWIIAGLLALAFLGSGGLKLIRSKEKLPAEWTWANDFSAASLYAIGVLEVLAAIGLILPGALDIATVLVPLAAVGLGALMVGAIIVHVRRHEAKVIGVPLILTAMAVFVAWGRFGPNPFSG